MVAAHCLHMVEPQPSFACPCLGPSWAAPMATGWHGSASASPWVGLSSAFEKGFRWATECSRWRQTMEVSYAWWHQSHHPQWHPMCPYHPKAGPWGALSNGGSQPSSESALRPPSPLWEDQKAHLASCLCWSLQKGARHVEAGP